MNGKKLLICLGICFVAEVLGGLFSASSVGTWYLTLQKPSFNPPGWVFGPVWTVLYLLMGVSLYLIWHGQNNNSTGKAAFLAFAVQLALNVAWSGVFFGLKSIGGGLVVIALLVLAIFFTIRLFRKISGLAALLLLPYFIWVIYASGLNFAIWQLNR